MHNDSTLIIEYAPSNSLPRCSFQAVQQGKYLKHTFDMSEAILAEGFKPFSLPWRASHTSLDEDSDFTANTCKEGGETLYDGNLEKNVGAQASGGMKKWTRAVYSTDDLERLVLSQTAILSRV